MKERRYKMFCMNNKEYILDEEDMQKLNNNTEKMLVKLKQVIVHPSSIIAIEPFYVDYIQKAIIDELHNTGVSIGNPQPPKPIPDLFSESPKQLT